MILKKILPRQDNFFAYFRTMAEQLQNGAKIYRSLVSDTAHADDYAKQIAAIEAQGDNTAKATFDVLHHTFITPFDRHDILMLVRKLDDVLDLINRSAKRIAVFKISKITPQIIELAELSLAACEKIVFIMEKLDNLKHAEAIIEACREVTKLEREADQVKMSGMQDLLATETDFKEFFKTKELYDYSKLIVSECHHLGNVVRGIVLEYS